MRTRAKTDRPSSTAADAWRNRQLPRYSTDMRIKIALPDNPRRIIPARTADLSTGGICVVLPQTSGEDALAMIGIRGLKSDSGDELTIWFRALLRHRTGFRRGYQFVDVSVEQKLFLRQLLLRLRG